MGFIGEAHAQQFNASYLVATKRLNLFNSLNVDLHLGYGVDWVASAQHQFVGFFGGAELFAPSFFSLILEYDAKKVNGGIRLNLFKHFKCTVALLEMDKVYCYRGSLGLGIKYYFVL